jgi:regulator of protease activity HflC (stomatin/prohibitin superfamily)
MRDEIEDNYESSFEAKRRSDAKQFFAVAFLIFGLILGLVVIFGSFFIIDAGERGILVTLGKPSDVVYNSGVHFKMPIIQSVIKFDVKTQKYEADASAASKDLQTVSTKMAINYHIAPDTIVTLYKEIGLDYSSRIIQPMEQEVVKASTARFTAEELITKREEVRESIKETLKERLAPKGIIVEEVSIVNFDFSKSFNDAIESKVTAEQQALAAKNKLEQVKYEAEQKIASAQAEATALQVQKAQVTPELIQLRQIEVQKIAVEKWDGKLPSVTGGAMPFIDIKQVGVVADGQ